MAYAFVNTGNAYDGTLGTTNTLAASYNGGETVLVIAAFLDAFGATSCTITDTVNTYTQIGTNLNSPNGSLLMALFKADNVAAGTPTLTMTTDANSTYTNFAWFSYTGLATGAHQTYVTNSQNGTTTTADAWTSGTITPTGAPAMVFAWGHDDRYRGTPGTGTGFTSRSTCSNWTGWHERVEDKRITTTDNTSATFTGFASDTYGLTIAAVISEAAEASNSKRMMLLGIG